MSEIPDDIMQAAAAVSRTLSRTPLKDEPTVIAKAILAERQRQAEVTEEVRKVLEPFAAECATWADDKAPDDYVIKIKLYSKVMSSKLRVGDLRATRALLSRLEER